MCDMCVPGVRSCVNCVCCKKKSTVLRLDSMPNWSHKKIRCRDALTRRWTWVPQSQSLVSYSRCVYLYLTYHFTQAKKKYYDVELENLEKQQKQTIEKMEADHQVRLKEETKRIRAEQDRAYYKFQDQLKQKKKEVRWRKYFFKFICWMPFVTGKMRNKLN